MSTSNKVSVISPYEYKVKADSKAYALLMREFLNIHQWEVHPYYPDMDAVVLEDGTTFLTFNYKVYLGWLGHMINEPLDEVIKKYVKIVNGYPVVETKKVEKLIDAILGKNEDGGK